MQPRVRYCRIPTVPGRFSVSFILGILLRVFTTQGDGVIPGRVASSARTHSTAASSDSYFCVVLD